MSEKVDLLMGGSPCQGFSMAGKKLNFDDPRSKLFFEFVRVMKECKPKYFLLENVKMKKEWQDIITDALRVEPIEINSALVSAQNRKRIYWTNIPNVRLPKDKSITLEDIVMDDALPIILHNLYGGFKEKYVRVFEDKSPTIRTSAGGGHIPSVVLKSGILPQASATTRIGKLSHDLVVSTFKSLSYNDFKARKIIRKLDPVECERLQTLPDNYVKGESNTARYNMIGNGWTVDVIAHIFRHIPEPHLFNVISLFDGISCGQLALQRAKKTYGYYYASEIDEKAIKVTQKNFLDTIQVGDVTKFRWEDWCVPF